uniref:MAK10-like protein n=1 Tax=Tanacetum cinerariifolium TaxID=118510 RepID=A0A6L2N768_TANCI|nr:MAK10-like protein [Tanacetum cinerariifolium]
MGDKNHIRTLGDYSRPSYKGFMNTIELLEGNNVVPLRSDTIWLGQNGCSFHGIWSKDLNQHLKDFLKLMDSLNLDVANRERTRMQIFQFSLSNQASNWLERLPTGSISTWEDLTTFFDGAFGGVKDEEVIVGEGVVMTSSLLEMLTNSCLGGIMVSLIFLEGLVEEALEEFMVELFEEDEKISKKYGLFNLRT